MSGFQLEIAGVGIRQDDAGRYCLNDLHRAAGGEPRHTPGRWTITQQFGELAEELSRNQDGQPLTSAAGVGTYVCKELVYAYAMWISPAFHLRVIRAYDALVTRAPALPQSFAEALRLAADQAEQLEQQRLVIEQQRPAMEFVEKFVDSSGLLGFRQVAKLLKANEREFSAWLVERGVMYRLAGRLMPAAPHMEAGRFEVKAGAADNGHAFTTARFTPKGVEWIAGEWGKHQVRNISGEAA